MKKIIMLLSVGLILLAGCAASDAVAGAAEDLAIKNEKIVKEFGSTVNVFNRAGDSVMLTVENGDIFENYNLNVSTGQLDQAGANDFNEQYLHYESVGDKGQFYVEGSAGENTLFFKANDAEAKKIAGNIGYSDSANVSVSPNGNFVVFTARKEGAQEYGLFAYDIGKSKLNTMLDFVDKHLIEGFSYMISWAPDEKHVIVNDKYVFNAETGKLRSELKSAYSRWSPSGSRIAFILDDGKEKWLASGEEDAVYPGKVVCVYDVRDGGYQEVFMITGDEYVFGDIVWDDTEKKIAFTGISVKDKKSPDWYMQLIYNCIYIVEIDSRKAHRLETNVEGSGEQAVELANLKFSITGKLLGYTVGNFEKSDLYVCKTDSLEKKVFQDVEYLHWIGGESYVIPNGSDSFYFSAGNSILRIDTDLKEAVKYTSKLDLDDMYLSKDGTAMVLFETQENQCVIRYIGK